MVWYFSDCIVEKETMAEANDENAARFMRSREIGVLESEFESRGNDGENTENGLTSGKRTGIG